MKENFEICTEWLLVHEGGYVNHPDDPGGPTNKGVTQRVYNAYRTNMDEPTQSVRNISIEEVYDIYHIQYWSVIWGDLLPHGLDYALYDFAVNSGPSRAVKFLQELLRVPVDGVMGNVTYSAILGVNDMRSLIIELCLKRWAWLKRLRHWKTFGTGWTRRVMGNITDGVQPGEDHGVIDRSMWLHEQQSATGIPEPKHIEDGASAKTTDEHLRAKETLKEGLNVDNVAKVAGGSIPAWLTAAASLPEGPIQWAFAFAAFAITILVIVWAMRKLFGNS